MAFAVFKQAKYKLENQNLKQYNYLVLQEKSLLL